MSSGGEPPLQAVGASGAIFGMVGAWAAFCVMNRAILGRDNAQRSLAAVGQTLAFNLFLGMSSSQIDNMGHVGVSLGNDVHWTSTCIPLGRGRALP